MFKEFINISICMLVIMISLSCQNQEREIVYDVQNMPSIPLEGELMQEELLAPYTKQMKMIQSYLFHFTPQYENVCLVTNEKADTIGCFGTVGNGPGEIIDWAYFSGVSSRQDTIYIYDTDAKRVNSYSLDVSENGVNYSFLKSQKVLEQSTPERMASSAIFKIHRLANGYFVGFRLMNSESLFTLFDENLNEVSRFGDYPIDKGLVGGEERLTTYFDGYLDVKGNSFYYGVSRFGYMARYDVSDDGHVTKVWENMYSDARCKVEYNNLRFYGENIEGFYAFAIGEKYIYAAYSGVESGEMNRKRSAKALYPKTLLVLDLNGKPLAKFGMDKCFVPLCLDEKEEYLYIQHDDPDTSLWRYKVSDILKHL